MRLPECPGAPLDPQAKWVRRPDRIVTDVGVGIDASPQPDRIALDVASYRGVEVSEVVLEQSRLCIEVLAGEAQVVAKRSTRRAPSYRAVISPVRSRP